MPDQGEPIIEQPLFCPLMLPEWLSIFLVMAGGWLYSLPYQNYGQNKIKITDKTRGNTATPSSDSEREAKTRKVARSYPTLIVYSCRGAWLIK